MMLSRIHLHDADQAFANSQQYIADSDGDVESLNESIPENEIRPTDEHPGIQLTSFPPRNTTPPAALWLRRSAANMDEAKPFSPSTVSISDEYELIDDAETASLASSENISQGPDDITALVQDKRDNVRSLDTSDSVYMLEPLSNKNEDLRFGQDIHDSMLSEDIETPRQSLWNPQIDLSPPEASKFSLRDILVERALHIMYFAGLQGAKQKEERLLKAIASQLSGAGIDNVRNAQLIELPSRPYERFDSTDAVYRSGFVDLHVQRIDGDERTMLDQAKLRRNADLALIYVAEDPDIISISSALQTLAERAIPTLIITEHSDYWGSALTRLNLPLPTMRSTIAEYTIFKESAHDFSSRLNIMLNPIQSEIAPSRGKSTETSENVAKTPAAKRRARWILRPVWIALLLSTIFSVMTSKYNDYFSIESYTGRQSLLAAEIDSYLGVNRSQGVNMTHLLHPPHQNSSRHLLLPYRKFKTIQESTFVLAEPNHVLVSIPKFRQGRSYPRIIAVKAYKESNEIVHNHTRLIDGIYCIDIDPTKAYGMVTINILSKSPMLNLTVEANFGHQLLRRTGYDKARSDLSVVVKKDLIVVAKNAKALTIAARADLQSGLSAAKDATDLIKVHLLRDARALAVQKAREMEVAYRAGTDLIVARIQTSKREWERRVVSTKTAVRGWCASAAKAAVPGKMISSARERVLALKRQRILKRKSKSVGRRARRG